MGASNENLRDLDMGSVNSDSNDAIYNNRSNLNTSNVNKSAIASRLFSAMDDAIDLERSGRRDTYKVNIGSK